MGNKCDLVTFGETMIRLSPPDFRRLEQTSFLEVNVAGSELNTAVAEHGYAIDNGEHEEGIKCFAAPLREYGGDVVGAISLTGLEREFDEPEEAKRMISVITKTATEISQALGYMGRRRRPDTNLTSELLMFVWCAWAREEVQGECDSS